MSGSPDNRCVVTEWQVSPSNGNEVDLSSRRDVLRIAHPQRNHNGGKIAFRPSDRYLYIAIGDGGNANDVGDGHTPNLGNAQDLSRLLGKILRIDPLAPPQNPGSADPLSGNGRYRNPASNPFLNGGGLAEIYAYGFRNPYRFSFDATADRLLVGDVGQNTIEEVDLVQIGRNYGWNRKEGSFLFHPGSGSVSPDPNPDPTLVNPVFQYDHGDGISVIGGSVYRGSALPALSGKYVFGDFLKPSIGGGRLFYGDLAEGVIRELRVGGNPRALNFQIRAFGSDAANELYILAENAGEGQVLKIVPIPAAPAFLNLSSRARVKADDLGFAIAGFIVTGSAPKDFVLRGVGPSLTVDGQPVAGRLADPTLLLQDSNGTPITTNDDWMNGPRQGEIFNLGLAPSHPKESAIIATLQPGAYTATMRGVSGGTGIGVVEIFDVARNQPANAVNLSTRADVGAGDNVLIGGLIIGGGANQRLIARAIGPSLASTRIPTPLQNPTLELVNASGMRIAFNDNWQSDQRDEIIASGLAPADDAESAIIMNLAPASYTAIVRGVGETGGVGLVEFFRLNPNP
ncbi:MAG: PQQ-dependent sugar dehydrogenase [Chthoniobacterales bacterium]